MTTIPAASARATPPAATAAARPALPPLEHGDRLARPEFERRAAATPSLFKAELIEGRVYVTPPPVSGEYHGAQQADLMLWLGTYRLATPGVTAWDNSSVRLDLDNMPQPDALLFVRPENGGRVRTTPEGYLEGAPEFVAEVAASSASYDLHDKLDAYRRHGVREYVVWRTYEAGLDYFILRDGTYQSFEAGPDGIHRSETFPGLWLDAPALARKDMKRVMGVLHEGVASPEHAAFVARLSRSA